MSKANILHHIEGGSATVEEALMIADCNFEALTSPVFDHNFQPIAGRMNVYRDDSEKSLGIHSDNYGVIQYSDAFSIINTVLGEKSATVNAVGSLNNGGGCMLQAKMPESIEVLKGDNLDVYLYAISAHDGSRSTSAWFSGIRLACTNQMNAISKEKRAKKTKHYDIRHTRNAKERLDMAQVLMALEIQCIDTLRENAQILASKSMNRKKTQQFLNRLFPSLEGAKRDGNKLKRDKVEELMEEGKGSEIQGVQGTAWGAFNAVTEWFDHHSSIRGEGGNRGLRSILDGDTFRAKVFETAMTV